MTRWWPVWSVVLLWGCGAPDATPSVFGPQVLDAIADTGTDIGPASDATVTTGFAGTWALATDWSTCVQLGSNAVELRSYKLLKVEVEAHGTTLRERRTLCAANNTPLLGQLTVLPQPLIDNMPLLELDSTVTGDAKGDVYHGGIEVQPIGVKLANPIHDAMPTSPGDPRIVDHEADGNPGGTMQIGQICQLYVANRAISSLHGSFTAPGRIEGGGYHFTEQLVLGGSSAFCQQSFPTVSNHPHHAFVMQRASGWDSDGDGKVSCAEIVSRQAQFVQWRTPDNGRCPPPPEP
jgi:hypothetical protein